MAVHVPVHVVHAAGAHRRRIIDAFRRSGATSAERATPLDRIEVERDGVFRSLEKSRILRSEPDGRFYLHEGTLQEVDERSARIGALIGITTAAVLALVIALVLLFR